MTDFDCPHIDDETHCHECPRCEGSGYLLHERAGEVQSLFDAIDDKRATVVLVGEADIPPHDFATHRYVTHSEWPEWYGHTLEVVQRREDFTRPDRVLFRSGLEVTWERMTNVQRNWRPPDDVLYGAFGWPKPKPPPTFAETIASMRKALRESRADGDGFAGAMGKMARDMLISSMSRTMASYVEASLVHMARYELVESAKYGARAAMIAALLGAEGKR